MTPPDQPFFQPIPQRVLTAEQACRYLLLDVGREGEVEKQIRSLDRLVDRRRTLKCIMYRQQRSYHIADLDDFLQNCRR